MKELKNRIKGLSAILLAVCLALCLVMRFLGTQASASEHTIKLVGIKGSDGNDIYTQYENCANEIQFSNGTGWELYSGGYFTINYSDTDSAIKDCITLSGSVTGSKLDTSPSDTITCYEKAIINSLPSNCDYVMITNCSMLEDYKYNQNDYYYDIYSLTIEGVYNTTSVGAGQSMNLTTGTKYSFPSGSRIHKVEGDPTNYYTTYFYASKDGTYTILQ